MPSYPFTTALFDLDGTLVDTAPDLAAALNHVLSLHALAPVEVDQVRDVVGVGALACLEKGFAINGHPIDQTELDLGREQFIDFYSKNICVRSQLYPAVTEVVSHLKAEGLRLAVCTNKPEELAVSLLQTIGIASLFDAICGSDTVQNRKPHPDHIVETIGRAGGDLEKSVMVGDTSADIDAAKAAGVPAIAMHYGYSAVPVAELGSDLVLNDFADLPNALHNLGK